MTVARSVRFATGILFLVSLLNAFDRQLAAVVIEPMRVEWQLSDAEIGLLSGAFALIYAVSAIPMGLAADRWRRFRFLSLGVFVWSGFTALGGFARSFGQLFATRVTVGISESTFFPASMSLLGDLYPSFKRNRAVGFVLLGIPIGISLAFGVGGAVAKAFDWRAVYYLAFFPGLLVGALCLVVREPQRGAAEQHSVGSRTRDRSTFRLLMGLKTFHITLAATSLVMFGTFALGSFLTPMLMRYHHMTVDEVGKLMAIAAGLSPIVGIMTSGAIADRLTRRRRDAPMLVGAIGMALSVPLLVLTLHADVGQVATITILLAAAHLVLFPFISFSQTILHEVVEPALRGTAFAAQSLVASVFGAALGPYLTGMLSDSLARHAAVAAGVTSITDATLEPFRADAVRGALYVVPITIAGAVIVLFIGLRYMRREVHALQSWMAQTTAPHASP